MQADDKEALKRWVETWKTTGALMEQFRAEDLRKLNDAEAAAQFIMLTETPALYDVPDDGLLEQQRLFQRFIPCKDRN